MATIPIPLHLRDRLDLLLKNLGSARAAAEALNVDPRELRDFLRAERVREATCVLFETRLQAYDELSDDFDRKQELAALACDLIPSGHSTVGDIARQHGLKGRAIDMLSALFRFVQGVPSPDGRLLQVAHENLPGGPAVWKVQPAPEPQLKPANVRRALEAMEHVHG